MTKNVTKKLTIALLSVFVALATIMGVATAIKTPNKAKAADETTYEDIYLTGIRSSAKDNMRFYWRTDGATFGYADYGIMQKLSVDYTTGETTTPKNITMKYTLAPITGAGTVPSATSTRKMANNEKHPCIVISDLSAVTGDSFTIPAGTILDGKFRLTQDYTVVFDGKFWDFSDDSAIPVELSAYRGGNAKTIYAFGLENLDDYYLKDVFLNQSVTVDCYDSNGTKSSISGVKLQKSSASRGNENATVLIITLPENLDEGNRIVLKNGTRFDNCVFTKDYIFKRVGTAWKLVECDGVNHTYADNFTCHDRICDCGHVEKATTEHTFETGTFPCEARICTTCGDTVEGAGHQWEGEGCEKTCSVCKKQAGVHTWDEGTITTPATCKMEGVMTYNCTKCDATKTEAVPKAEHTIAAGAKTCSVCGYRIPYTADDMDEILASENLSKYVYSDFHADDEMSDMGRIYNEYTDGIKYGNTYLLNTTKLGDKNYKYDEGHSEYANMLVGFSLTIEEWAAAGRSGYVYLAAHENGSWGIGFMFTLINGNPNLRIIYKSTDGKQVTFVNAKTINVKLNEKHYYQVGIMKNDDGSIFAFAFIDDELFLSGTLSAEQLNQYSNEATHNGLGGAASIVFNGSTAAPSVKATICDKEHKLPAETFACNDYDCEICGTTVAHTAEHDWGKETLKEQGSCTVKDKLSKTCKVCGKETVYDGDFRHEWDEEHPTIVTKRACNNVDEVVKYPCKLCGEQSNEITLEGTGIEGGHKYEVVTVTEATCVIKGKVKQVCSKCHDETAEQETTVNEDNHKNVSAVAGKAATCTESGIKDHFVCSDCDKKLLADGDGYVTVSDEDLVIAALGHDYKRVEAVAATCEENGVKEHYKCDRCNKLFVKDGETYTETTADELIVAATGHDYTNGVCKNCNAEDPDYVAPKKKGCKSDVNAIAMISLFAVIIVASVAKKKYAEKN